MRLEVRQGLGIYRRITVRTEKCTCNGEEGTVRCKRETSDKREK